MNLYGAKPKYEEDILVDIKFYFHAENQQDADSKIWKWNRHHGYADCPGYGFCKAVKVDNVPSESWIHDEWIN